MTGDDEALAAPLSVLGLTVPAFSMRSMNNGCNTVGDVVALTEIELWKLPGVGPGHPDGDQGEAERARLNPPRPDGPPRPKWK